MHKSTERERSATRPMKTSELKQKRNGRVRRTDPVRPMTNNLAETVFVFESTRKPYQTHVVYLDQASCYVDHPGWKHTATLEPAVTASEVETMVFTGMTGSMRIVAGSFTV